MQASGTFTFLFTDVEDSSRAWLRDQRAMGAATARHDELIEQRVAQHGGHVVRPRGEGDSRFAVFPRASDAVAAACAIQVDFQIERWSIDRPLRIRVAVHTGEADKHLGDYYGPAVNQCAALRSVAYGGQVLLSNITAGLVRTALPKHASLKDLGLHLLKGVDEPERVWQLIHPRLRSDFPPLRSRDVQLHNLPSQLSSFVGRDDEMVELARILATTRLLTLTGPGGIGKTRLAMRLAGDYLANFKDGVWLVRLDAITDAKLVPPTLASVVGVREQPGRPLPDVLAESLAERQLLAILDNCEHLLQACAELVEPLLQACPGLQILATSRERLGVTGEVAWPVPSLAVPGPAESLTADQVNECASARLFLERAVAANPDFALTDANAESVAQVCRRLDGQPLALELAAARLNALSIEHLAQRLDDRLRLLAGGRRTALPRHQTLRAAIDWSHALLSQSEQVLFRRLAVFAGGWTLEAAEAVCPGAGIDSRDVLDLLCSLVDRSLVSTAQSGTAHRYRQLDTIREYALERLDASGEAHGVGRAHIDYFLSLAELAEVKLRGREQVEWFRRLEAEHDNLRAALTWALEHRTWDLAERLGGSLWFFWYIRGHVNEGAHWLQRVLATSTERSLAHVRMLNATGYLLSASGARDASLALHEEALALSRELGDTPNSAESLRCVGRVTLLHGDYARGTQLLHEALALFREMGDSWSIGLSLNNLGNAARARGDYEQADALYRQSLGLQREIGNVWGIAVALGNLAGVATFYGDVQRSAVLAREALSLQRELGMTQGIAESLLMLGTEARSRGAFDEAQALFEESLLLRRHLGNHYVIGVGLTNLGFVALRQRDLERATTLLGEALMLQKQTSDTRSIALTLNALASTAATSGFPDRAARLLGAADRLRDAERMPRSVGAQAEYDRTLGLARAGLDESAFEAEFAAGRELTLDEAIAEGLETIRHPTESRFS